MRVLLSWIWILVGGAAYAADDTWDVPVETVRKEIDACLEEHAEANINGLAEQCIGNFADRCMGGKGGSTTVGITACTMAETRAWDALLNEVYAARIAANKARDAEENIPKTEEGFFEDSLRDAQRAWLAFRDAECKYQPLQYWAGTIMSNI